MGLFRPVAGQLYFYSFVLGFIRGLRWFEVDVSKLSIGSIFKVLTLEDGTYK
jgi:hypothetical protein